MNPARCRNCDTALAAGDRYCPACGQKRIDDSDRRLPALLRSSLAEVTDLDGRLLPSLFALMLRPGTLSREYRLGRRNRYLTPIALFLFANLAFFLAPTVSDLNLKLYDQYTLQPYSNAMQPRIDTAISHHEPSRDAALRAFNASYGGTPAAGPFGLALYDASAGAALDAVTTVWWSAFTAYSDDYEARIGDLAKSMVIAHVPLIALGSFLLTLRKRLYFADHVVAALHFFAFLMLFVTLLPYTLQPLIGALNRLPLVSISAGAVSIVLLLAYAVAMLRNAFSLRWVTALLLTPPFIFIFYVAHSLYRLAQLWIGLALV